MNKVKVSVIIPIFNAEEFIQNTLDIVCQSTLKDIEILAINDGSNDNTLSVLNECAKKDKRIRVIDKPNGGIFDARNRGLQEARGEYVCFCDHDDIVESRMYELMYNKAIENECDLVMCSTGKYAGDEKLPDQIIQDCILNSDEVKRECFLPLIFNKSNIYHSERKLNISNYIWKCMIKRNFIEKNHLKFQSYVNYEDDRVFLLDILSRVNKVALISNTLYYWRVNPDSASHDPKYVDNMYEKDLIFQDVVKKTMVTAGCDEGYIQTFENLNSAMRYTRLVWNEVNHTDVEKQTRINSINCIFKEDNFDIKVRMSKYFLKNMFWRKIVCQLLSMRLVSLAYDFCKYYIALRHKLEDKSFWVKTEQKVISSTQNKNK